jgi:hypothetical protein
MTTTKQHPPEKDAKHHDKPAEKAHKEEPKRAPDREPAKQRVLMKNPGGDEVVVTHGTESYHIPRDGEADLPPEVAMHVIRQGGARAIEPRADPVEGSVQVRHADPATRLSYGEDRYPVDRNGLATIPLAILEEVLPHGFQVVVEEPAAQESKHHGSRGE